MRFGGGGRHRDSPPSPLPPRPPQPPPPRRGAVAGTARRRPARPGRCPSPAGAPAAALAARPRTRRRWSRPPPPPRTAPLPIGRGPRSRGLPSPFSGSSSSSAPQPHPRASVYLPWDSPSQPPPTGSPQTFPLAWPLLPLPQAPSSSARLSPSLPPSSAHICASSSRLYTLGMAIPVPM